MAAGVVVVIASCAGLEPVAGPVSGPDSGDPPARAESRTASPTPTPVVVVTTVVATEPVAFTRVDVDDPGRDLGTSAVTTLGVAGVRTLTYEVTQVDGVETARVLTGDEVTVAPVDEVTSVGTREPEPEPAGCDPNYEGACVPVDSDVDCAGGSGNGPSYVDGPVHVTGTDIYGLDSDDDGVGCEA